MPEFGAFPANSAATLLQQLEAAGLVTDIQQFVGFRHAQSILAFDGSAGKGAVGESKLYDVTGVILVGGLFIRVTEAIVSSVPASDAFRIAGAGDTLVAASATPNQLNSGALGSFMVTTNNSQAGSSPNLITSATFRAWRANIVANITGNAFTDGTIEAHAFWTPAWGGGSCVGLQG